MPEKHWFKLFTSNRRKALTSFSSFNRNKKEKDYKIASDKADELIQHQISIEILSKNSDYNSLLPGFFSGHKH
ncbi:hypothetical protein Q7M76_05610 (plasmid) [Candidatus Liberibacter asiaticus]|uniref:hypothetical protein n=1 Tax=Liberibacter asiaticus TaxID=34021 RepID=UPI000B5C0779|nr:hypothetical protein [Candidatus Liberibacter asiaticus]ARB06709.1 hypothetical protein PJXGC_gp04 [Liberibacter phage P-JXGC-3]ASK53197.1 hypothetical protein B2I23_05440 [Candidatus Liberibacter asiaticus]MBA2918019.1 hypothetical protein [Candidatus Liberibacter asiaticus]RKL52255.1 hypothetical protein D2A38_05625 [Candidatus Liberibacter asiaticus]